MMGYMSDIDEIVRKWVGAEIEHYKRDAEQAREQARISTEMQKESWREAHVGRRINEYRKRWELAQEKLDDIARIIGKVDDPLQSLGQITAIRRIIEYDPVPPEVPCTAVIMGGPGSQSKHPCERTGPHEVHYTGDYDVKWRGETAWANSGRGVVEEDLD